MTCKNSKAKTNTRSTALLAVGLAAAIFVAGCGNYSNEDLEFMNAVPEGADLSANLPEAQSAVLAQTAELYQTTRDVSRLFNGTLDAFLRLFDAIRSYSPSSRAPDSRTWGPYDSKEHPGWMVKMVISRDQADPAIFHYSLGFVPVDNRGADALILIDGTFASSGGIRRGQGTMNITTQAVRAAGIDPAFGFLDHMEVTYNTMTYPISVNMDVTNLPNVLRPDEIRHAVYIYKETESGQGQMQFDFWAHSIPGPALDKFNVTSRWLGTGEGRSDVQVLEGEATSAKQVQCWDRRFQSTFHERPWDPPADPGDPAACPDIPLL